MGETPRVLAVVLAKGSSTRCPGKNGARLGNKPMIRYAAEAALGAKLVTRSYVSTDSSDLAALAGPDIEWIRQPHEISTPSSTIEQALAHALVHAEARAREAGVKRPEFDYVVGLQCAVPVRPAGSIDALIRAVVDKNARGGVTVVPRTPWMWSVYPNEDETAPRTAMSWWNPVRYPRSQDVAHRTFEEINSIQITPRDLIIKHRRHEFPMVLLELPQWADLDIDTAEDIHAAQVLWPGIQDAIEHPVDYTFQSHLVNHEWRPPSVRFPLQTPWAEGLSGVVIGNAPILDSIKVETWREIQAARGLITLGVNRVCASISCARAGFSPTLHMIWDQWPERTRAQMNEALRKLAGRTWRLSSPDSAPYMEHDQVMGKSVEPFGPPSELRMRHGSADAAANLLYRLGCRSIYFLGCGFKEGRTTGMRCRVPWDEGIGSVGAPAWQKAQIDALTDISRYPGVRIYSMDPDTDLVDSGLMEYGWPDEVNDPFTNKAAQAAN